VYANSSSASPAAARLSAGPGAPEPTREVSGAVLLKIEQSQLRLSALHS